MHRPLSRRLDCCDRMIRNESRDPNGCNVYYVTMQITFLVRTFLSMERNLHCDVVHITTVWTSSLNLDCNSIFAIKAYGVVYVIAECILKTFVSELIDYFRQTGLAFHMPILQF